MIRQSAEGRGGGGAGKSGTPIIRAKTALVWLYLTAGLGASAVMCGAFGAHALKAKLSADQIATWNTAVLYHLVHSVVLLAVVLYAARAGKSPTIPAGLLTAGIALFSGSIYVLVLGGPRFFGPVTPLGGLLLMAAWVSLVTLR